MGEGCARRDRSAEITDQRSASAAPTSATHSNTRAATLGSEERNVPGAWPLIAAVTAPGVEEIVDGPAGLAGAAAPGVAPAVFGLPMVTIDPAPGVGCAEPEGAPSIGTVTVGAGVPTGTVTGVTGSDGTVGRVGTVVTVGNSGNCTSTEVEPGAFTVTSIGDPPVPPVTEAETGSWIGGSTGTGIVGIVSVRAPAGALISHSAPAVAASRVRARLARLIRRVSFAPFPV